MVEPTPLICAVELPGASVTSSTASREGRCGERADVEERRRERRDSAPLVVLRDFAVGAAEFEFRVGEGAGDAEAAERGADGAEADGLVGLAGDDEAGDEHIALDAYLGAGRCANSRNGVAVAGGGWDFEVNGSLRNQN